MTRFLLITLTLFLSLSLAGCGGDPAKLDSKLAQACTAAVKALYPPEDSVEIKKTGYRSEKSHDKLDLRVVTLSAHYIQNGGMIVQKEYVCAFEISKGALGSAAKFYRMEKDGTRFGNFDGMIEGDYTDLLKIQSAVDDILL